ncbi:MAG TPA: DUF5985 family protein [Terracidiphilus sp.]|jgi:hypothetical protein|nr:DUF5985 family protein [Terracidiphilus sp.]
MNAALYILICLTMLLCAVLLFRAYFNVRRRLLLWSGLCFAVLTISNLLVALDLVIFTNIDLYSWRLGSTALALVLMLYGLIWESQ